MKTLLRQCAALAIAIGSLGLGMNSATACDCAAPVGMQPQERNAWLLDRATEVVQGRIVDFHVDASTTRGGENMAAARMKIVSVVKGDLPVGDATIFTRTGGDGDCGIPSWLLSATRRNFDVTLQVTKMSGVQGEYLVDMCGYAEMKFIREN